MRLVHFGRVYVGPRVEASSRHFPLPTLSRLARRPRLKDHCRVCHTDTQLIRFARLELIEPTPKLGPDTETADSEWLNHRSIFDCGIRQKVRNAEPDSAVCAIYSVRNDPVFDSAILLIEEFAQPR